MSHFMSSVGYCPKKMFYLSLNVFITCPFFIGTLPHKIGKMGVNKGILAFEDMGHLSLP